MAGSKLSRNVAAIQTDDLVSQFRNAIQPSQPWDSIIDFATHPSFCGLRLYPRQQTLLKLIHLETENMTAYDIDVIDGWAKGFLNRKEPAGVQEDIWERIEYLKGHGYTHFPHVQAVQGRRASKGMIGGVLGAERMAYLLTLDDPQAHFGIAEGKDLYLSVVATNSLQAKKFMFADIRQAVEGNPWMSKNLSTSKEYYLSLRTPADRRRIAEMRAKRMPIEREIASIRAIAMSSTSSSGRGGTGFANFFDEFAHMVTGTGGPRTSDEVYDAYQPSLDQFGKSALTYIPSSPYTKVGKFFELYTAGRVTMNEYRQKQDDYREKVVDQDDLSEELEKFEQEIYADPELLVVQLPSWALYEDWEKGRQLVKTNFKRAIQNPPLMNGKPENERMVRLEKRDPVKFKVERRAQFAEVMNAYLEPEKVEAMFKPFRLAEDEPLRYLERQEAGTMGFMYHGHVDPSKSNANFAIAIGHLEQSKIPDEYGNFWSHVIFDYLHVYQPKNFDNHTVDYIQITEDMEALMGKYRTLEVFSFDQWNSVGFIAKLKQTVAKLKTKTIIKEVTFTGQRNQVAAEQFKTALNLGWIHAYKDDYFNDGEGSLLEQELKFLMEKNGKVVKQSVGPVTTKDLSDTVMEVSIRLLQKQLEAMDRALLGTSPSFGLQGGYPGTSTKTFNGVGGGNLNSSGLWSPGAGQSARDRLADISRRRQGNGGLRSRGRF